VLASDAHDTTDRPPRIARGFWTSDDGPARRAGETLARRFAFAVLMGVCFLGIHSAVDFNLQIPANALAFTVLLAYGRVAQYLNYESKKMGLPYFSALRGSSSSCLLLHRHRFPIQRRFGSAWRCFRRIQELAKRKLFARNREPSK